MCTKFDELGVHFRESPEKHAGPKPDRCIPAGSDFQLQVHAGDQAVGAHNEGLGGGHHDQSDPIGHFDQSGQACPRDQSDSAGPRDRGDPAGSSRLPAAMLGVPGTR